MPRTTHALGVALAVLAFARPSAAALGEGEESVSRDRAVLRMELQASRSQAGTTVHELRGPGGSVRQYVGPSGTVFAVAWSGGAAPDLPTLLGAFHGEYRAAAAVRPALRGPRRVETARIVVETWGHQRDLHGRAWIPSLVPAGVTLDDLQ